jgi:aryl sulfotransferase
VAQPERSRVYQNHHLDSTRWDQIALRPSDIVISTAYKAGTTLTQMIVGNLVFWGQPMPDVLLHASPWIEMRRRPIQEIRETLEAQTHRRFLKSHVGLDGIPYREDVSYLYVGRDPRDVFVSLWNHYSNHVPEFFAELNGLPGRVGEPFPPCPNDIHELWSSWITRGWFEWENDGYPYWSLLHHAQSWWEHRTLRNLLCVHYSDLLRDLEGEIRRIASFLAIERSDEAFAEITQACRFETAKKNAKRIVGDMRLSFRDGNQTFFHRGTNGRWKDILTSEDLTLYRKAMKRLPSDLAGWLENGAAGRESPERRGLEREGLLCRQRSST